MFVIPYQDNDPHSRKHLRGEVSSVSALSQHLNACEQEIVSSSHHCVMYEPEFLTPPSHQTPLCSHRALRSHSCHLVGRAHAYHALSLGFDMQCHTSQVQCVPVRYALQG